MTLSIEKKDSVADGVDMALRAGDWVEVKGPQEIARTLDQEGTLDGLPFMPEMLAFCGRRFRVTRRAEKTCVEVPGTYHIREFRNNDVVLLDAPRCSGADHDGCQRACTLFWKTAWLEKIRNADAGGQRPVSTLTIAALRSTIQTKASSTRYFCQSTELSKATCHLSRGQLVFKCFVEVRTRSRRFFEMARLVLVPVWRHFVVEKFQRPLAVGSLKQTPVVSLALQPGEIVRIKPEVEIVKTLDSRARNRGLRCDRGMRTFCGGEYRVRSRLDRMISETTGEMREVQCTVMLEGLKCICEWTHVGGCPREDYMYWREAWLDRVPQPVHPQGS